MLQKSPLFHLSMASKELFHSNMIYWIWNSYPRLFCQIMKGLGVDTSKWPNEWSVHREYKHFDLAVCEGKEDGARGNTLLLIENKVKSVPYKEQLDRYRAQLEGKKPQMLLLSLATEFPHQKEIEKDGWLIVNYKELAAAIRCVISEVPNSYHQQLLNDYCHYISCLHQKQEQWKYQTDVPYLKTIVHGEENVDGLEDVRKKIMFSRMAIGLQQRLKNATFATNKEIMKDTATTNDVGKIFINWGMSHSQGLLDVKIRVRDNLLKVIQIQGNHYRHCVELLIPPPKKGTTKDQSVEDEEATIESLKRSLEGKENQTEEELEKFLLFRPLKDEDKGTVLPQYDTESISSKKPYNKFGAYFIYRYTKIGEKATIQHLLDRIEADVQSNTTDTETPKG